MADLSTDPVINGIYKGMRRGIEVTIQNGCLDSSIILVYSGIDAMAYLGMPASQDDVTRKDFMSWVDRYMKFPCTEQVTGVEFYGARCGMLHNYSVYSDLSRQGKCRVIGYKSNSIPPVIYAPEVNKNLVLVSVSALAESFFRGVDQFLVELFADQAKAKKAEERLKKFVQCVRIGNPSTPSND